MEIRLAKLSETEIVKKIVDAAFSNWIDVLERKPMAMLKDFAPLVQEEKVYLGRIQGEAVGVLVMWVEYESLYVDVLAVDPKAQKQGVGQRLLHFAEAEAEKRQQNKISLCTNEKMQANRDYYAHLGYEETRHETLEDGRVVVWLEKPLLPDEPEETVIG